MRANLLKFFQKTKPFRLSRQAERQDLAQRNIRRAEHQREMKSRPDELQRKRKLMDCIQ